jgi:hypothetical protein
MLGELGNQHIYISTKIYRYSIITQQRKSGQKRRLVPTEHPNNNNNNNNVTYREENIRLLLLLSLLSFVALQPSAGYYHLVTRGSVNTNIDMPQSVGLLLDE